MSCNAEYRVNTLIYAHSKYEWTWNCFVIITLLVLTKKFNSKSVTIFVCFFHKRMGDRLHISNKWMNYENMNRKTRSKKNETLIKKNNTTFNNYHSCDYAT